MTALRSPAPHAFANASLCFFASAVASANAGAANANTRNSALAILISCLLSEARSSTPPPRPCQASSPGLRLSALPLGSTCELVELIARAARIRFVPHRGDLTQNPFGLCPFETSASELAECHITEIAVTVLVVRHARSPRERSDHLKISEDDCHRV